MLYALLRQPLEDYDLSRAAVHRLGRGAVGAGDAIDELTRRLPERRDARGLRPDRERRALVLDEPAGRASSHGTVGQPMPGAELRIVDERDNDVPAGEVGRDLRPLGARS